MNLIQIAGHLGKDPETRFTSSGQKVTTFSIACNIRRGGKDETIWFKVTVWGDRFDKMIAYLKKGSAVIVIGELGKPEIYTDREGRQQISLEITAEILKFSPFGKPASEGGQQQASANAPRTGYSAAPAQPQPSGVAETAFAGVSGYAATTGQREHGNDNEEEMPF